MIKNTMSRKQFVESHGATCKNWTWSWSFVNEKERFVIFGAWDIHTKGGKSLILDRNWKIKADGKKAIGYKQSRDHIGLVKNNGYALKIFQIKFSSMYKNDEGFGPAKIESFVPKLNDRTLEKIGENWYASDEHQVFSHIPDQIDKFDEYVEGLSKKVSVNVYERNADARRRCIEHHGYKCSVCSFDFKANYGAIGDKYIHIHHKIPIAEIKKEYILNAVEDLIPVCPNCHAMIHRVKPTLTVEQLKSILKQN